MPDRPGPLYLPGDPEPAVDAMIRVDHAGEFGAVRIYEGQLAVLSPGPARDAVAEMAEQEKRHHETFDRLIAERRVRPTLLTPLWRVAGFALGAMTARMGPRAAMACTAGWKTSRKRLRYRTTEWRPAVAASSSARARPTITTI